MAQFHKSLTWMRVIMTEQLYQYSHWGGTSARRIYSNISTVSLLFYVYLIQKPTKEIELEDFQCNVFCRPVVLLAMCLVLRRRLSRYKYIPALCTFISTSIQTKQATRDRNSVKKWPNLMSSSPLFSFSIPAHVYILKNTVQQSRGIFISGVGG